MAQVFAAQAGRARRCVFESSLICTMSKWLTTIEFFRLARSTSRSLREVEANLDELDASQYDEAYGSGVESKLADKDVAAIVRRFPGLRSLDLFGHDLVTDAAVVELAHLSKLRELNIYECSITATGIAALSQDLEKLTLDDNAIHDRRKRLRVRRRVDDGSIRKTSVVTRHLAPTGVYFYHDGDTGETTWEPPPNWKEEPSFDECVVAAARRCPRLRTLRLISDDLTDDTLIEVASRCSHLKSLYLACGGITDRAIIYVAEHCDLESLELTPHFRRAEECGAAIGANCPNLKTLSLHSLRSEAAVRALAQCTRLETLRLSTRYVTDESIALLVARNCNLIDLFLACYSISDVGVMAIARSCPMLKSLEVRRRSPDPSAIRDESVVALASGCPRLQTLELEIGSEHITDEFLPACDEPSVSFLFWSARPFRSFMALARCCIDLREFKSTNCQLKITDAGLIAIGQRCSLLRRLDLRALGITDAGVAALSRLEFFALQDNFCVTASAAVALMKRSPSLTTLHFRECGNFDCIQDKDGYHLSAATILLGEIEAAGEADAFRKSHPGLMKYWEDSVCPRPA